MFAIPIYIYPQPLDWLKHGHCNSAPIIDVASPLVRILQGLIRPARNHHVLYTTTNLRMWGCILVSTSTMPPDTVSGNMRGM